MTVIQVQCLSCARPFEYDHVGSGRHRRTCSPACHSKRKAALSALYRAEGRYPRRVAAPRPKTIPKVCVVCGAAFLAAERQRKACGLACGGVLAKRNGDLARTHNAVARRRRVCEQCGVAFVMRNPSGAARAGRSREGRFCSKDCVVAFRAPRCEAVR